MFCLAKANNLSTESVDIWIKATDELSASYRALKDRNALLSSICHYSLASVNELDPMTMATYDILTGSIMDTLIKMQEAGSPITDLIDKVTDIHLDYIEKFQESIKRWWK